MRSDNDTIARVASNSTVAIRETGERCLFHGIDKQGRAVVRLLGVQIPVAERDCALLDDRNIEAKTKDTGASMTTEELAKLIAERIITADDEYHRLNEDENENFAAFVAKCHLKHYITQAIRDLNLIQAEPMPEGAVPVVVYVSSHVDELGKRTCTACCVDDYYDEHRALAEVMESAPELWCRSVVGVVPIFVPTVKAVSRPV